jgi:TolA-binding protein
MSRHVVVLLAALLAFGCSQKNALLAPSGASASSPEAPASANRYLAYEHSIGVEAPEDKIAPMSEAVQAACRAATAESCAILEARITTGEYASAQLRFRATAKGVQKLIEVLSAQGEIASRSTTAEDLAGPIEDHAKKLAMLTDYRAKLEALRTRSNADVDSLIKLTRELAQVQGEIESLSGSQAQLVQRVETELLNVSISSHNSRSFWSPIAASASDFGENLAEAIATFITAIAYLLPWALLVVAGIWAWRRWRRRRKAAP